MEGERIEVGGDVLGRQVGADHFSTVSIIRVMVLEYSIESIHVLPVGTRGKEM